MRIYIFAVLTLMSLQLVQLPAYSQEFYIQGVIKERETNRRISVVSALNKRTLEQSKSDKLGLFSLQVKVGDTIVFKKNAWRETNVVVENKDVLMVYLIQDIISLKTVTITGTSKKTDMLDIKSDFVKQGVFYGGKPPLILLNPLDGKPLTFFYELFGKTPKRARRFNTYYQNEVQQLEIDHFFNRENIEKASILRGEQVEKFMLSYRPDYESIKDWTEYDAMKYIGETAQEYIDSTVYKKPVN